MAIESNDLQLVRTLVLKGSGIVLDESKAYLVEARLSALFRKRGLDSMGALLHQLRGGDASVQTAVVEAMTTNETSFFRDVHPFEVIKTHIIPELLNHRADRKLTIWCAASSTGQEPYTLAILLREHFPQLAHWQVQFLASDLSSEVLAKARAGRYSQLEINRGLPASLLVRYFKKDGLEWQVCPEVRRMIDFQQVNLLETWPLMPPLDIVLLRNVLIYFDVETKRRILGRIRNLMRPEGYLFLGAAETTLNLDDHFVRSAWEKSGCYRLQSARTFKAVA